MTSAAINAETLPGALCARRSVAYARPMGVELDESLNDSALMRRYKASDAGAVETRPCHRVFVGNGQGSFQVNLLEYWL